MVVWEFHNINYYTVGGVLNVNAFLEFLAKGIFGISQTQIGAHLTHMNYEVGFGHLVRTCLSAFLEICIVCVKIGVKQILLLIVSGK